MKRNPCLPAVMVLALLGSSCGRAPGTAGGMVRLIDRIGRGEILRSPLAERGFEAGGDAELWLPASTPLLDGGSGPNPFGLKLKLRMGGAERNVLLAPPTSEFTVPVRPGESPVLEFGIGIRRPEDAGEGTAAPAGAHFAVALEIGRARRSLFSKYLEAPPPGSEEMYAFSRHIVDVPVTDRNVRLILKTRGEESAAAFWVNPVLFERKISPRGVILVSIDTLRADHLGCYGYGRPTTPHIDALAEGGALFKRVYASSPWTLPSHVSMLTGLHGFSHQVERDDERMDPEISTLADRLRAAGFSTGAFTGGGFVSAAYGFSRGFDSYDESPGGVHHQDSAARVFQAASEWLERHRSRDYFLFLHTYQPHSPYACPPPHKVMFLDDNSLFGHADLIGLLGGKNNLFRPLPDAERKNLIDLYDGEVRYTDDLLIAPLVDRLRELDLFDRCLLIVTSDHGEEFFDHGGWGHGHSLYEEALHVPLVMKCPGGSFAGKRVDTITALVDLLPTICELMDVDPGRDYLDGRSLLPLLSGNETGDREFTAELTGNLLNSHVPAKTAVNRGRAKLILSRRFEPDDLAFFAFPPPRTDPVELYDLDLDPGESRNQASSRLELVQSLIERIRDIAALAAPRGVGKAEIDEKLREQLKALGYIR